MISENQILEKLRSVSKVRKISGPEHLDFFLFLSGNDPESLDVIEPSQETEESNTTDHGNLLKGIDNKLNRYKNLEGCTSWCSLISNTLFLSKQNGTKLQYIHGQHFL